MKKTFLLLFCSFFLFAALGQENDSLLDALKNSGEDTIKANILHELCFLQDDPAVAKKYALQLLDLSIKIKFPKGMTWGYNLLGTINNGEGNFQEALRNYKLSLELLEKQKDSLGIAKVNNNMGESYRLLGDHTSALEHYFLSLRTLEKLNKQKLVAMSLSNIGIIYRQQKNPSKALEYYSKSLAIREKLDDKSGMATCYDNIGIVYYEQKKYPEAIRHALKALDLREAIRDTSGLASSYNNISNIYSESGDLKLGLSYQLKSLAMREYMKDKRGIAMSYNNLGNICNLEKNYKKAMEYQLLSLEMAKAIGSKELLRNSYESLVTLSRNTKDYEKAFFYQNELSLIKDSILNAENSRNIAEMQTKYETEKKDMELNKKDLELSNNQLEISSQRNQRNVLIVSILLILVSSYLFYSRYKTKQKDLMQQELIRQQELRSKAIIEAEEKERTRIAQELHDGVGQQLSAVKLNMSSLQSMLSLITEQEKELLQNSLEMIDESVKEVRSVSHNMMPNALLKSGLAAAVREFLNRISSQKLKIELGIFGLNERLETTTEAILFRVLQEVVNNIIKHAEADHVEIQLIRHENELSIMIEDNGKGFDPSQTGEHGIGLKNIMSRVSYLGGKLNIDSKPGKGTTISIEVPVR